MGTIQITSGVRVTRDPKNSAVRELVLRLEPPVASKGPVAPRAVARSLLSDNADLFLFGPKLPDLRDGTTLEGPNSFSVRFTQTWKEVPVDSSEVIVNLVGDGRPHTISNQYHYDIPAHLDPAKIKFDAGRTKALVAGLVNAWVGTAMSEPRLLVYQFHGHVSNQPPKGGSRERFGSAVHARLGKALEGGGIANHEPRTGDYFLAWEIIAYHRNPTFKLRFLVDADSGHLIDVIDLLQYASGTAKVFDPNPIVTSGDLTLSSTTATATLDAQAVLVSLTDLNAPDGSGKLHLDGPYADMEEFESPTYAEPVDAAGNFQFSYSNESFLDSMAYFHVDRFQGYIQGTLALTNVCNIQMIVDPQAVNGADNSAYVATGKSSLIGTVATRPTLTFGAGPNADNPIPDAADAMVVLHEYGHAIQDNSNPGFDNPLDGTGEGFGDFLAAVYYDDKHATPTKTRGLMMSWDANTTDNSWPGRRYDVGWLFTGPEYTGSGDNHIRGQLWCATMFEIYRKFGGDSAYAGVRAYGRDLALRLHLAANFGVPASGSTAQQMATQVEAADSNLGGWRYADGLHKKVVYDAFRRRKLSGFPDLGVDVYIDDGRKGGYGSLSGNDAFSETLFMDNFWETEDIWCVPGGYASPAAQAAGTPADHVEPVVGTTAYLYVRVKNRGTNGGGSGSVTVKAFHCDPGMGLVWPDDWTPMDVPSLSVANVLPGDANAVVVGPFTWTPTEVGHECALAIVECADDHAVTQDLLVSDHVPHYDLVPFDNNIAQRNLVPTSTKQKTTKGFWIRNPDAVARVVDLAIETTLPKDYRFSLNLASTSLRLGPLERRWVELTVAPGGAEVTDFGRPMQVRITGTIEGRSIGGMTFRLAPPGQTSSTTGTGTQGAGDIDLCCLRTLLQDAQVEGEIDVRIRFRKK